MHLFYFPATYPMKFSLKKSGQRNNSNMLKNRKIHFKFADGRYMPKYRVIACKIVAVLVKVLWKFKEY